MAVMDFLPGNVPLNIVLIENIRRKGV